MAKNQENLLDEETMPTEAELMGEAPDEESTVLDADAALQDEDGEDLVTNVEPEKSEPKPAEDKQQLVPHQALHQERVQRQELAAENKQLKSQLDTLTGRMDQLMQMFQQPQQEQPKQPEDPRPDPEEQPFEFMQWQQRQIERLETMQRERDERMTQREQQEQAARQQQELINTATQQAKQFRESLPDPTEYDKAFEYVFQKRGEELLAMGMPPEQVPQALNNETIQGIHYAMQNKINPGQMLYNMAKSRGFQHAPQQQTQPTTPPAEFRSMRQGNTPRTDEPDMQMIANMSEDDFARWMEENGDKGLALMHGVR